MPIGLRSIGEHQSSGSFIAWGQSTGSEQTLKLSADLCALTIIEQDRRTRKLNLWVRPKLPEQLVCNVQGPRRSRLATPFGLGASLEVTPATPTGGYSGTFSVTAQYN
jgi:hypothetical protein